jgi:hypothetical protein
VEGCTIGRVDQPQDWKKESRFGPEWDAETQEAVGSIEMTGGECMAKADWTSGLMGSGPASREQNA